MINTCSWVILIIKCCFLTCICSILLPSNWPEYHSCTATGLIHFQNWMKACENYISGFLPEGPLTSCTYVLYRLYVVNQSGFWGWVGRVQCVLKEVTGNSAFIDRTCRPPTECCKDYRHNDQRLVQITSSVVSFPLCVTKDGVAGHSSSQKFYVQTKSRSNICIVNTRKNQGFWWGLALLLDQIFRVLKEA